MASTSIARPQAKTGSENESGSEQSEHESRKRKPTSKKRHHRKRSESPSGGENTDKEHRRHKHKRSKRSDSSRRQDQSAENKTEPLEETEEQYDARLEREEKERLEAERKKELERLKQLQAEVPTKNGVRFKGASYLSIPFIQHADNILRTGPYEVSRPRAAQRLGYMRSIRLRPHSTIMLQLHQRFSSAPSHITYLGLNVSLLTEI